MASPIPPRLTWAVDRLGVAGDERILEIGCGRGIAVSLIRPLLRRGSITAIDRSATAIDAARERHKDSGDGGNAVFHRASIEDFDGDDGAFDIVFAVNVNLFWLNAGLGLSSVRRLLADEGRLFLFYEAPSPAQRDKIAGQLHDRLSANGYEILARQEAPAGNASVIGVTARAA